MNPNLLTNRELDNYIEQDSFDFLTKAEAIRIFLEQNSTSLEKNKMIVLYGDWGSGKTSLMRHIEKTIDNNIYKTIFFEAWEHEKDENLALSLCDALTGTLSERSIDDVKTFMRGALMTLKGFASGITLKLPKFITPIVDLEISGEKIIKGINEEMDRAEKPSFYKSNKIFKKSFTKVENAILEDYKAKKILVFIDDLDRCEPENVLNLITAMKLFFTYGENTIFICGMDKEAVNKAVKTKYHDVIKSEEYMEKVFDVSFNMPKTFSLKKMIEPHFRGNKTLSDGHTFTNSDIIEDFLRFVRFTNPRHLKKILSKYEIIKSFKVLGVIPKEIRDLIPNIIDDDNEGNVFETIFCLFVIILHEFYHKDFVEIENYEEKMQKYIEPLLKNSSTAHNSQSNYNSSASHVMVNLKVKNHKFFVTKQLNNNSQQNRDNYLFTRFVLMFSHSHPGYLTEFSDPDLHSYYQNSFTDSEYTTLFCKFIIKYKNDISINSTDYPIWNLFEMVKYLL